MLVVAAVAADELHPRARQRHVEDARVGGVGQVEAHDLAAPARRARGRARRATSITLPKRPIATCVVSDALKGAILPSSIRTSSSVSEQLAVDRRPVVRVGRDDEDVAVEAHLLAVVLADVRVVPVDAGIGNVHLVGEASRRPGSAPASRACRRSGSRAAARASARSPRGRRRFVDVDGDRRALADLAASGRESSRCRRASAPSRRRVRFLTGIDLELELVAVGELDHLGRARLGQALGRASGTRSSACAWYPSACSCIATSFRSRRFGRPLRRRVRLPSAASSIAGALRSARR